MCPESWVACQTLQARIHEAPFDLDEELLENWPHIAPVLTGTKQCCINPQSQRNLAVQKRASAKAKGKAKAEAKSKAKAKKAPKAKAQAKAKAAAKTKEGPNKPKKDTAYNIARKEFFAKFLSCTIPDCRHCRIQ